MKKSYETPTIEKIAFSYRDQVVVASSCYKQNINHAPADGTVVCEDWEHNQNLL